MDTSRTENGQIKITILGKSAVGKSSLCLRFIMNSFSDKYDPSIQETHRKNFVLDQKAVQLEINDTTGQEDYLVMLELFIKSCDGILLVYSVDKENTLEDLNEYVNQINNIRGINNTPIVLIANKTDLENRQISKEQGEDFAKQIGAVYLETSAKFDINCEKAFTTIVREVWAKKGINLVQEDSQNLKKKKKKKKKKFLGVCNLI